MSLTAEIKGLGADRFRAYANAKLLRVPTGADHYARAKANLPPLEKGARMRYNGEQIAADGPVEGDSLKFTTKESVTITKVVFYKGPVESEVVVGSTDVNASGKIAIDFIDPPPAGPAKEPQIVEAS